MNKVFYDVIGDLHGNLEKLEALLEALGYAVDEDGVYRHVEGRVAAFLGDFIDPKVPEGADVPGVLRVVRAMVEGGSAVAVIGNHEFNAVAYTTPREGGGYLRPAPRGEG